MKKIEITKANTSLASYARNADEPVIVTKDGRPVLAVLNIGDLDWETLDLDSLPIFISMLGAIQDKLKANRNLTSEEIRWLSGIPPHGWQNDARFAQYLEDEDEEQVAEPDVARAA